MAPTSAVLISEGISWVILKVLCMATETLTLNMNCLFKWKLLSLALFITSFQSVEVLTQLWCSDLSLLPEINTHQLLPWKQNRKKLYLLLSCMSCHLLFTLVCSYIYVYLFYASILCSFIFSVLWFSLKVYIWFSRLD